MYRSGRAAVFGLFAVAYFLSYFFRSANAVIAADLTGEFALTAAQLGLMTSLFYASFALMQIPLGIGLDRFGPRFVTPGFMLAGVAGGLIFASARSFEALALGRALIGLGMGGVLMGALKAFAQWFPPGRVATFSGFMVGIGAAGGLAAATPLALVNELVGWRAIFAWGALVILLSAGAVALWTRNTPPGVAWQRAGVGGLGQVFRDVRFWRIAPLNFFLLGTQLSVQSLWGGPYLFDAMRLDRIAVGDLLLAMGLGVMAGYLSCGWLADRFGMERVVVAAASLFLACQAALLVPPGLLPLPLLGGVYAGFGFAGSFNIVLLAQIRTVVPAHLSGRAVTAGNLFGIGGTALIQWWMGLIIGAFPPDGQGRYGAGAYGAAFLFTAVCTGAALAWYLWPVKASKGAAPAPVAQEKEIA